MCNLINFKKNYFNFPDTTATAEISFFSFRYLHIYLNCNMSHSRLNNLLLYNQPETDELD